MTVTVSSGLLPAVWAVGRRGPLLFHGYGRKKRITVSAFAAFCSYLNESEPCANLFQRERERKRQKSKITEKLQSEALYPL